MKFLQVWLGGKIPELDKFKIENSCRLMDKNDEYILIDDSNFEKLEIEILASKYADIYRHYINDAVLDSNPRFNINVVKSNFVRYYLATKFPDMLYFDIDVELSSLPNFIENKAYFSSMEDGKPWINNCLFYVNNRPDLFGKLLEISGKTKVTSAITTMILYKVLNKEVALIPHVNFLHKGKQCH